MAILSISCSDDTGNDECILPKFDVPVVVPTGSEAYLNDDSDVIFNQDSLHTFHIRIPGNNLDFLDTDPIKEEYTEAMLIFKNDTLSPIGLRYKGSIGSFNGYLSNGLTGSKISTKLSMKIKVNWLNKSDKFYDLKKLQFHSMNNDPSLLKERLGYWLYRSFGVTAPRCVHAKVYINDSFQGIFALVEQIDGRFVDYNFSDDGNVYKDIWPIQPDRTAQPESMITSHLKTNEEEGDISNFKNFATDLENVSQANLKEEIEKWFDTEKLIKNMVVNHSIQHNDEAAFSFKNCGVNANIDDCSGGNIYWFSNKVQQTVELIPWDLDEAEFITPTFNLGDLQQNCASSSTTPVFDESSNTLVYIDKLKCGFFEFENDYLRYKNEFDQTTFNSQTLDPLIVKWKNQIRSSVFEASELYDDAPSEGEWETSIERIKSWD